MQILFICSGAVHKAVLELIGKVYGITIPREVLFRVMGHTADQLIDECGKVAIMRLLYRARKLLALHWMS